MMPWTISGASVAGTSHDDSGAPCQDAYAYHRTEHVVILAVGDGAGSAPHGEIGASLATLAATSYIAGALEGRRPHPKTLRRLLRHAAQHARNVVLQHAEPLGHDPRDYATTLLVSVITEPHVGVIQMGDGAIVTQGQDGTLDILTRQQDREYVNEVTFLTCDNYQDELRVAVRHAPNLRSVCLVTDGVETVAVRRATNAPHPGFFNPLLKEPLSSAQLATLLTSAPVCERTDDDKTILIANKGGEQPCCMTTAVPTSR